MTLPRVDPGRAAIAVLYMAGIFALSSLPGPAVARLGLGPALANLAHVPVYAGLAWVTLGALLGGGWRRLGLAAAICLAYAVLDELHQSRVPGRTFAYGDLGLDGLGVALALAWDRARAAVRRAAGRATGGEP